MSVPDASDHISRKKSRSVPSDKSFEHRLLAYAAAASAAGVAAISLAQPCQAEIVYTKVQQDMGFPYSLDLNNDGIVDFTFYDSVSTIRSGRFESWRQFFGVEGVGTNQVLDTHGGQLYASALVRGSIIGSGGNFNGLGRMDRCEGTIRGTPVFYGSWVDEQQHYLGFAFSIDGQTHYGWARVNSRVTGRDCKSTIKMSGYAYETVPGKAIEAGKEREKDDIGADGDASAAAGTLGSLALGSVQSRQPDSQGSQK